jgi:hypothetical protein
MELRGAVVEPVEHQNLVLFDGLKEFAASGVFRDPQVKIKMTLMHFEHMRRPIPSRRVKIVERVQVLRLSPKVPSLMPIGSLDKKPRSLRFQGFTNHVMAPYFPGSWHLHSGAYPRAAFHQALGLESL